MNTETNEFSFVLKPSTHGVGVFAMHDIAKDTFLQLFGNKDIDDFDERVRDVPKTKVPKEFRGYCLEREGGILRCPDDFSRMFIGWYLNYENNCCIKKQIKDPLS